MKCLFNIVPSVDRPPVINPPLLYIAIAFYILLVDGGESSTVRIAVRLNFIPGSLKARAYFKRIFIGKLISMPAEIIKGMSPYEPPVEITLE